VDSIQQTSRVRHPSFRGRIGTARADITPPVGIYARNWGAAEHDLAESIHRPLTLTALTLQPEEDGESLVLINADAGWWRSLPVFQQFQTRLLERIQLPASAVVFALTHTHSAPPLTEGDSSLPGGEALGDYLKNLLEATVAVVRAARADARPALLQWHIGHCSLAAVRDLPDPDPDSDRILCGFNPDLEADTTLWVGRVTDDAGAVRAVLANYACHPTTLAWENRAISPDYVGALRELVESACGGAPLLFLQGASGDLAPRYQYVGDTSVADRHGRQLGFAVLQTLQDMSPPGNELYYDRAVESGAPLAVWRYREAATTGTLRGSRQTVDLPLKNWPTAAQLEQQRSTCEDRVLEERLRRKRNIRRAIGDGNTYALPFWAWRIGDALLVGSMAESYSALQLVLRRRFPDRAVLCLNLVNGSIGYLPPATRYDQNIYQVWQTPFDRGSLEETIDAMTRAIEALL